VSVANRTEKVRRDFLSGGISNEFKFHLAHWSIICTPMILDGLEVRNLIFGGLDL
jgi:hypothetical protein